MRVLHVISTGHCAVVAKLHGGVEESGKARK
jgi:hypothetical protein